MLAVLNFCQCMRNPCLFVFCCGNLYIYIWWMYRYPTSFRACPTRFLLVFHAILTHTLKYCICAIFCLFQIWASLAFGRMGECKRLMSPHPYQVPQHQHIVPMLFFFYTVMMMVHGKHDYHCNRFIIIGRLRSFCFSAQLTYLFFLLPRAKHLSEPRETEPLGSDLAGLEEHRHTHHHRLLRHQQCPRHHLRRPLPPPSPHQQLFLGELCLLSAIENQGWNVYSRKELCFLHKNGTKQF